MYSARTSGHTGRLCRPVDRAGHRSGGFLLAVSAYMGYRHARCFRTRLCGAKVIELLDDFVDEIFTKSKGKQIVWWCWMGITLGLMLTLMIAGFSWGVTLGLVAAVAVGIYASFFRLI